MSKICKKGYMEITKTIYLEPEKNVPGRSILHYSNPADTYVQRWDLCSKRPVNV